VHRRRTTPPELRQSTQHLYRRKGVGISRAFSVCGRLREGNPVALDRNKTDAAAIDVYANVN
jgi:hypothetical protein